MEGKQTIVIGMPNYGTVRIETVNTLLATMFVTGMELQCHVTLVAPTSCYIPVNRDICVEKALKYNASYLFFLDTDMIIPDRTIIKLVEDDKDIVGAPYNFRAGKSEGRPIVPKVDKLSIVDFMPTGCLLIKMDVFRKMDPPWFKLEQFVNEKNMVGFKGEDVYFCHKAKTFGYDTWCDPEIEVGHIGTTIF